MKANKTRNARNIFFSAEDRVKLDGIQAEAEVNVQAD
jgi:hypothetical protein